MMTTARSVRFTLALLKALKEGSSRRRREADAHYIRSGYDYAKKKKKVDERRRVVTTELGTNNKVARPDDDDEDVGVGVGRDSVRRRGHSNATTNQQHQHQHQHQHHGRHRGTPGLDDAGDDDRGRGRGGVAGLGRRKWDISQHSSSSSSSSSFGGNTIIYHKPYGVSCRPDPGRGQVPVIQLCTIDREYKRDPAAEAAPVSEALHPCQEGDEKDDNDEKDNDEKDHDEQGRAWYEPTKKNKGRVMSPQDRRPGWTAVGYLDIKSTGLLVLTTSRELKSLLLGHRPVPHHRTACNNNNNHNNNSNNSVYDDPRALLLLPPPPPPPPPPIIEKEFLARIPQLTSDPPSVVEGKLNQLRRGVASERDWHYDNKDGNVNVNGDDDGNNNKEEEEEEEKEEEDDALEVLTAVRVKRVNKNQVQFVLDQVRRHHVRRMCRAVGWDVRHLKRVRVGRIRLDGLPCGSWRYLNPGETFLWPQQEQELEQEL